MKHLKLISLCFLVVGGVILWNAWVLGWLNHGAAGYTQMSISELNAAGQPFSSFFILIEFLSGVLLFIGASLLMATIRKGLFLMLALGLTSVIGLLTVYDAMHPVDCNPYQNNACVSKVMNGEVSLDHVKHETESTISGVMAILLALILVIWVFARKRAGEYVANTELAIVSVLALMLVTSGVMSNKNIVLDSLDQRLFNTLISVVFLYVAYRVWFLEKQKLIQGKASAKASRNTSLTH